jgi:hypothetical protein
MRKRDLLWGHLGCTVGDIDPILSGQSSIFDSVHSVRSVHGTSCRLEVESLHGGLWIVEDRKDHLG